MTDSDDAQTGELENLRPNAADDIYNTLKIALAGGAGYLTGDPTAVVAATLASIFTPPIQKRRDRLLLELAKGFVALNEKIASFSIAGLANDESFITVLTHAVQAAMRAHQQEKLDVLRNAVLNAALHTETDEDIQIMFLNFVDNFTPWHLRVLKRFHDNPPPHDFGRDESYLVGLFPELLTLTPKGLGGQVEFFAQLVRDLEGRGLIDTLSTSTVSTTGGTLTGHMTELGHRFLRFITSPATGSES